MDWSVNVGKISECIVSNLVKVYSRCHLRRLRLGTSSIDDFIREYTESLLSKKITRETKIILIGCGMEFYERRRINFPISVDHILNAYYGLDLTRLKVYFLEDFKTKNVSTARL